MKRLQIEISQISTDLTRNLKIRIISISVLYRYFFEIFHFHIESNLIVFCIDFSISPILDLDHFRFPTDAFRCSEWAEQVNRLNWKPSKASVVCSNHFRPEDFERESFLGLIFKEFSQFTYFYNHEAINF
jgi:THAP domain